ncbi:hypothetical protein L1887_37906 [Cichorium endivia]|nr:hypothetical protein L1887_37906 [Cichorium endivia]
MGTLAKSILTGDLEWYFFCPTSRKYQSGHRKDRATETGYWKGTGIDREVKNKGKIVAKKKTLIFHEGHSSKGKRTDWVMHEFQMKDEDLANQGVAQDAYVICKVFEKSGIGPKNGAQYGAPFEEKDWDDDDDDERSTVTSIMMVGVLVNPDNVSSSSVKNITSTEPGPSTVTHSALVGLSGATANTLDPNASTLDPSTIASLENEKLTDVPVNADVMITHADLASMLNNDNQEVEDRKGKKISSEEDDGLSEYEKLVMYNQQNLSPDRFNCCSIEDFPDDDGYMVYDIWK